MKFVYMIIKADRGDGYHRIDTSGLQVYATREVAQEDLNRWLFPTGYIVVELPVVDKPLTLPKK